MFYNHNFLKTKGLFSDNAILTLQIFCVLGVIICLPLFGYLSDIIGRRKLSKYSFGFLIIFTIPLYQLILSDSFISVVIGFIIFSFVLTIVLAVYSPIICDEANINCRVSVLGIGYTLIVVIGSFTPMVNQVLVRFFQSSIAPAFYIIIASAIALITLYTLKDKQIFKE